MGVVYRARDLRKEETGDRDPYVALKVLSDEFRRDQRMIVALQRESRKAQSLGVVFPINVGYAQFQERARMAA